MALSSVKFGALFIGISLLSVRFVTSLDHISPG